MPDSDYRPSPALDYQEHVRSIKEDMEAKGWTVVPEHFMFVPFAMGVKLPPGQQWPGASSAHEELEWLHDVEDILQQKIMLIRERIALLMADCSG